MIETPKGFMPAEDYILLQRDLVSKLQDDAIEVAGELAELRRKAQKIRDRILEETDQTASFVVDNNLEAFFSRTMADS